MFIDYENFHIKNREEKQEFLRDEKQPLFFFGSQNNLKKSYLFENTPKSEKEQTKILLITKFFNTTKQ